MTRMCQYGDCSTDVVISSGNGISVNYHGQEKPVFCCGLHAALWLLRRDGFHRNINVLAQELADGCR